MRWQPLPEFINGFKIIQDLGNKGKRRYLIAECKLCKKHFRSEKENIKSLKILSCGCKRLTNIPNHLRSLYTRMKNSSHKLCEEWEDNKTFFKWALDNGYKVGLRIYRINPLLGFYPENCRFISKGFRNNQGIK